MPVLLVPVGEVPIRPLRRGRGAPQHEAALEEGVDAPPPEVLLVFLTGPLPDGVGEVDAYDPWFERIFVARVYVDAVFVQAYRELVQKSAGPLGYACVEQGPVCAGGIQYRGLRDIRRAPVAGQQVPRV